MDWWFKNVGKFILFGIGFFVVWAYFDILDFGLWPKIILGSLIIGWFMYKYYN